jgi:hypothetical protein
MEARHVSLGWILQETSSKINLAHCQCSPLSLATYATHLYKGLTRRKRLVFRGHNHCPRRHHSHDMPFDWKYIYLASTRTSRPTLSHSVQVQPRCLMRQPLFPSTPTRSEVHANEHPATAPESLCDGRQVTEILTLTYHPVDAADNLYPLPCEVRVASPCQQLNTSQNNGQGLKDRPDHQMPGSYALSLAALAVSLPSHTACCTSYVIHQTRYS